MCTYIYTYRENLKGTKVRDRYVPKAYAYYDHTKCLHLSVHMLKIAVVLTYIQCIYKNILWSIN